ncbi:MAG: TIGR00341 family protein [Halobacteriaceae archaeon]
MRLVQVMVPAGKRDAIVGLLDEEDLDYVVTDETSGREFAAVVYFPLPTEGVEPILDSLRDRGLDKDSYTVVIDAETVISSRFEELEERFAEDEENGDRIAREELIARSKDLSPSLPTFLLMTVVSGVIATAGLLLDSPAVVVGSMVIAPLVGPSMAAAVGTVVNDRDLFTRGLKLQILGMLVAVGSAAAFALLIRTVHLVPPHLDVTAIPEVRERLLPDFLSLVVALGAGIAGVVSLSSGVSTALVGVMIAVALVPPAATVGIALAWQLPWVGLGAGVLALVNWLSINLAALAMLWYRGYRPGQWFRLSEARSATLTRIGVLVAAIAVLSLFLGGVTLASYQSSNFEEQVRDESAALVTEAPYEDLTVLSVEVHYGDRVPFREVERVVVTVGRPTDQQYPGFAEALHQRIASATGRDVAVQVRLETIDRAGAVAQPSKGSSSS